MINVSGPKFNGLAVSELTVNLLGPNIVMRAKAAFVDTSTGATCGWTEGTNWRPETISKLKELLSCLEADIASTHFGSASEPEINRTKSASASSGGGGIGEHLAGEGGVPQV